MRLVNEWIGDKVTLKTKITKQHVETFVIILKVYPFLITYTIIEFLK